MAVEATGSNHPKSDWYYHPHGIVTVLKIDGKKVTRLNDIEVGALPEAVAFTPDGKYIYVGNYMDKDFSILRVDDTKVTDTDTPELACWFAGRKAAYVLEDNDDAGRQACAGNQAFGQQGCAA